MDNPQFALGLDIGSNSVGSAWIDLSSGEITCGVSIFPAGIEESDKKRGEPRNAKRRAARRARVTLARRSQRKRQLRAALIKAGLLPPNESAFRLLLQETDPWELRRKGLDQPLTPYEFGRVLLHISQHRGALGLNLPDDDDAAGKDDGKIKKAIIAVQRKMVERDARTFGEFIALVRAERVTPIHSTDKRAEEHRVGQRVWRDPIRNRPGFYEHCADRSMIRDEFIRLWKSQETGAPDLARLLTDELRRLLDNEESDARWRHKGMLFGQRAATWDPGTRGRCALHPTDDCVPHADRYASRYLVVEYVNNLRILEGGRAARCLTAEERSRVLELLCGEGRHSNRAPSIADLRVVMGNTKEGWGQKTGEDSRFRLNIESDKDRTVPIDWFSWAVIHNAVGRDAWQAMNEQTRDVINRLLLKCDPTHAADAERVSSGVQKWAGLDEKQALALVEVWKKRPKPDAKRLNMSRRAVRNLLRLMDRAEPWPVPKQPGAFRWLTQIEARRLIAEDDNFLDTITGKPLDEITRRRYQTGVVGATKRDRHYIAQEKHWLKNKSGSLLRDKAGIPLAEPPPAPWISNPVVRKSIHEVRRHVVAYLQTFGAKPDHIHIELAREARMSAVDADRALFMNRLRNRIRRDIIRHFNLEQRSSTQQRVAVDRVVLCVHQGGVCALCGNRREPHRITERMAAYGENCEIAHILPRALGGHNGFSNIVLAHTSCNQLMLRRTPRQFWDDTLPGKFEEGMVWIEKMFREIQRIKPSETDKQSGEALWKCYLAERARPPKGSAGSAPPNYFSRRPDWAKIEQFKKDITDIRGMTDRQKAATQYASRLVMTYLADALFDGKGLPERGDGNAPAPENRRIIATDGMWTARLRKEWRLFFDPHGARTHKTGQEERALHEEKNRADHRHHAVDAIVVALTTASIRDAWDERERQADRDGIPSADEVAMENYRRAHLLRPPPPFGNPRKTAEDCIAALREAVRKAVYGIDDSGKPVSHRPAKRKLTDRLHEDSLLGPILDPSGNATQHFRGRIDILELKPAHLKLAGQEAVDEDDETNPSTGKGGIVLDSGLRARLRAIVQNAGLNPDKFAKQDIKRLVVAGAFKHESGVPIRRVVLRRTMNKPVLIQRKRPDYATGNLELDPNPRSLRAYLGGNNHHIEIRVTEKGRWNGALITGIEAAQRNLARLRALREAGVPNGIKLRQLPRAERRAFSATSANIDRENPIVDRRDNPITGRFVMSLSEGEMLWMRHKKTKEIGYFVVAKLDSDRQFQVVPHWDARPSQERKDEEGHPILGSTRDLIALTPTDLKTLAPPGHDHARKVRVSPLGVVTLMERD